MTFIRLQYVCMCLHMFDVCMCLVCLRYVCNNAVSPRMFWPPRRLGTAWTHLKRMSEISHVIPAPIRKAYNAAKRGKRSPPRFLLSTSSVGKLPPQTVNSLVNPPPSAHGKNSLGPPLLIGEPGNERECEFRGRLQRSLNVHQLNDDSADYYKLNEVSLIPTLRHVLTGRIADSKLNSTYQCHRSGRSELRTVGR